MVMKRSYASKPIVPMKRSYASKPIVPMKRGYARKPVSLVMWGAADSAKQRRDVAKWLRRQADHVLKHGHNYATRFTAGLNYR